MEVKMEWRSREGRVGLSAEERMELDVAWPATLSDAATR